MPWSEGEGATLGMLEVMLLSWSRGTELVETQSTEGPRPTPAISPVVGSRRVCQIP